MTTFPTDYQATDPAIWQGRKDSLPGERFFQKTQCLSLHETKLPKEKQTLFLGFASDAGISRNEGRPGASLGPDQIRTQLAKLPCHEDKTFLDIGNIQCKDDQLEAAQEQFAQLISHCHKLGHRTIAFGGGHEMAWPHFKGLSDHYSDLGIINFDAHFDLRPLSSDQKGSSGTPFLQIADHCQKKQTPFSYCCLGIQEQGNTASLFKKAHELKVSYLTAEEIYEKNLQEQLAFLDQFIHQHSQLYLTICLDVFSEAYAPGVSAPQPLGITPWQALPLLKQVVQSGKVVSFDIAELSPPLDRNAKTARLAANLVAKLLGYY